MNKKNIILLIIVALIIVAPLVFIKDSEFGGTDGAASELIMEMNEGFEPWSEPLIAPPGSETESLLFALQAALGAGVICYILGYMKGKNEKNTEKIKR